jgi:predicted secreted protein
MSMYSYCTNAYIRLPWLRFFLSFPSVVRQMPGQNLQRRGTARTLPNFCVVVRIVCFVSFSVLFVCICVLYYCHQVATQLQLNISYPIISYHILYQIQWLPGAQLPGDDKAVHSPTSSITVRNEKKLRGLSPRANYTDRAAAAGRRS